MMKTIAVPSKREIILQHAAGLFREQGFAASSMRELANRVGVEPSTLYSHISGKDELLRDICFRCAEKFTRGMMEMLSRPIPADERIKELIDLHIDIAVSDLSSITVFNDEWKHLNNSDLKQFKAMRRQYERDFTGILQQGIEEGSFRPMDVRIMMYSILSAIRWIHYWYKPGKKLSPEHIKAEIRQLVLHGLSK